jgi:ABC-2 type transport system ATP-binding protein
VTDGTEASIARLTRSAVAARRADAIQTMDSDAVARFLLTATPARDVEIVTHNLEDAFLALTSDDGASAGQGVSEAQVA